MLKPQLACMAAGWAVVLSCFRGEGHLKVARWSPQQAPASMHGSRLGGWRCHVSEEKATSRWRGGPRNRHQLHRCTARRLESLHRPTRPPQGGELLHAL
ncbi:hypothetical protein V6N13_035169 [Hibiscus sabdariffa]